MDETECFWFDFIWQLLFSILDNKIIHKVFKNKLFYKYLYG